MAIFMHALLQEHPRSSQANTLQAGNCNRAMHREKPRGTFIKWYKHSSPTLISLPSRDTKKSHERYLQNCTIFSFCHSHFLTIQTLISLPFREIKKNYELEILTKLYNLLLPSLSFTYCLDSHFFIIQRHQQKSREIFTKLQFTPSVTLVSFPFRSTDGV